MVCLQRKYGEHIVYYPIPPLESGVALQLATASIIPHNKTVQNLMAYKNNSMNISIFYLQVCGSAGMTTSCCGSPELS